MLRGICGRGCAIPCQICTVERWRKRITGSAGSRRSAKLSDHLSWWRVSVALEPLDPAVDRPCCWKLMIFGCQSKKKCIFWVFVKYSKFVFFSAVAYQADWFLSGWTFSNICRPQSKLDISTGAAQCRLAWNMEPGQMEISFATGHQRTGFRGERAPVCGSVTSWSSKT